MTICGNSNMQNSLAYFFVLTAGAPVRSPRHAKRLQASCGSCGLGVRYVLTWSDIFIHQRSAAGPKSSGVELMSTPGVRATCTDQSFVARTRTFLGYRCSCIMLGVRSHREVTLNTIILVTCPTLVRSMLDSCGWDVRYTGSRAEKY